MSQDLVRASEIRSTLNSKGWFYIARLAEAVVRDIEEAALAEEDESRIVAATREARAARKFLKQFLRTVEVAGSAEPPVEESILVAM